MKSLSWLVSSSVLLAASVAAAQPAPLPPRIGLELAGGLSVGEIQCESAGGFCNSVTEAGGIVLNAAYFVNEKLAVTGDFWVLSHRGDDFTFNHYVNTVGVKWRPFPILTLQAGLGAAHATLDYRGFFASGRATTEDAFAVMAAVAVDVVRGRRWALSLEARFGNGFYGDDEDNDGEADIVGRNVGVGANFTVFGF